LFGALEHPQEQAAKHAAGSDDLKKKAIEATLAKLKAKAQTKTPSGAKPEPPKKQHEDKKLIQKPKE
jgi:hypothetical protein